MTTDQSTRSDGTSHEPLSEDELRDLKRAYHELEAFQLSAGHLEAKRKLREQLGASTGEETGQD